MYLCILNKMFIYYDKIYLISYYLYIILLKNYNYLMITNYNENNQNNSSQQLNEILKNRAQNIRDKKFKVSTYKCEHI
jgi:hypothetical protein